MEFNRWWASDAEENYWLEVTDRRNLGEDLNAPQQRDDGEEYYGYSLIKQIKDGDIIFHYHKDYHAIVACSKAIGNVWEDKILWGAHGTVARGKNVRPYIRPGWRLGLVDFRQIDQPITLSQIRALQNEIQTVKATLISKHRGKLYFPFELSDKRELRPTQAYLTKFPKNILHLFPDLQAAADQYTTTRILSALNTPFSELGAVYRFADEEAAVSERDPFTVDPALVERANRSHASTQNKLAKYLREKNLEPRSPAPGEPNFDLAWVTDNVIFVAEVKSLTPANEEKQLRLGLGQVLRYRHLLAGNSRHVRAALMVEREPTDASWFHLCRELDVLLIYPSNLDICL